MLLTDTVNGHIFETPTHIILYNFTPLEPSEPITITMTMTMAITVTVTMIVIILLYSALSARFQSAAVKHKINKFNQHITIKSSSKKECFKFAFKNVYSTT